MVGIVPSRHSTVFPHTGDVKRHNRPAACPQRSWLGGRDLDGSDGGLGYSVTLDNSIEVEIDATTGTVLESDQAGNNESAGDNQENNESAGDDQNGGELAGDDQKSDEDHNEDDDNHGG